MRRGEIWRYNPKGALRDRDILIVSSDGINESSRPRIYAVEITDGDPQEILSVALADGRWVQGLSLAFVRREWLVERPGTVDAERMEQVDAMLRGALDL